MAASYQKDYTV